MSAAQIPFTRGIPAPSMLPGDEIRAAAEEALRADPGGVLSYAPGGYLALRRWIAARHGVEPERVLVVNGSLQGLWFVAQHACAGGLAFVEDPTYDRTLTVLRGVGAEVAGIPLDEDGLDVAALEEALRRRRPALVYVIPTFQNPSGVTLSLEKRRRLVELVREHDLLLLEDDPYGLLRFEGDPLPTLHELDGGEHVIYSSSFTKTVAPGLRTGYLVLPEALVEPFGRRSTNTYIGPNTLAAATLAVYCNGGRFEPGVERATALLRERRDAMERALRANFPADARWTTPRGGYFHWVELPPDRDTRSLLDEATAQGVPFVAGADFSASGGARSSMRLAFSYPSPSEIEEGIARLAGVVAGKPAAAPA
jgi:2-aminoadipate transaminase